MPYDQKDLKIDFSVCPVPQRDVPPAPKPRDIPPQRPPHVPPARPAPKLNMAAMVNHSASLESLMAGVTRQDITEGRIDVAATVAQIAAMTDAHAQRKAFMTMQALCDMNLAEQMNVVARRKAREGQHALAHILNTAAITVMEMAEKELKEGQS